MNANITLLAPPHGGHMGFLSAREENEDRYWVENRAIEFFKLLHENIVSENAKKID